MNTWTDGMANIRFPGISFILSIFMLYQFFTTKAVAEEIATLLLANAVILIGSLLTIEMLYRTRRYEEELYQSKQNYDPMQHLVEAH